MLPTLFSNTNNNTPTYKVGKNTPWDLFYTRETQSIDSPTLATNFHITDENQRSYFFTDAEMERTNKIVKESIKVHFTRVSRWEAIQASHRQS